MKEKISSLVFMGICYTVTFAAFLLCTYPFYYLFINTLSDPLKIGGNATLLLPSGFTLHNYITVFKIPGIAHGFFISASRTVIGTAVTVFFCSMFAYTLTVKKLFLRKSIYRFAVITMYFNAGLIPYYLTLKSYGLTNHFLVYILPGAISPFLVILIKTYIEQVPPALEESARIDGANYFTVFTKVIIPVCIPVIAAVAVFSAVGQWNSWFDNYIFANSSGLKTLQLVLYELLSQTEALANAMKQDPNTTLTTVSQTVITPMSIRMTVTMVVTIPVIFIYPLLQRFFVKGIMIGAVKG